jgi:ribonuclease P protein component
MISSAHRFHGRKGLRYVYQQGKTTRSPDFAIKSVLNTHRRDYRLAVVVSRKVEKSAVARNRIRRRLYAGVRALEADILQPYDMVITVFSSEPLQLPAANLSEQLESQLRSAGILAKRVKS